MTTRMPMLLALFASLALSTVSSRATEETGPFRNLSLADAMAQAKIEGKPVFIDLFATWCGPCKMLDRVTWADDSVRDLLQQQTIAVKVDVDAHNDTASDYNVESIPTLVLLDPRGTEIWRTVGYVEPQTFLKEIKAQLPQDNTNS